MSELLEQLRESFDDEDYRNSYSESFMNSYVAAQIKTLREEYPLTQAELAEKIGTQQPGVARLENVNYSSWKVETLRKIARALNVRLRITFEEFGTLLGDIEGFNRERLLRASFEKDPVFSPTPDGTKLGVLDGSKGSALALLGSGATEGPPQEFRPPKIPPSQFKDPWEKEELNEAIGGHTRTRLGIC
ncbi:MAG: helix-turn-helix transcriptional regulator [Candidatus Korobacteraceae bacterium]